MKNKRLFYRLLVLSLLIGFSGCRKEEKDVFYKKKYIDEIKAARKNVFFFMSANNVPGASFAISLNGELVYSEGLGLASKDLEVPATRETKYRIGQVSELFTSLMYQLMVEDGTLQPDSTIQTYLKDFPETNYKLRLRHLVNHSSGLPQPTQKEKDWRGLNVSLQQGIENINVDSLPVPPGTVQVLNMYNYNLLGAAMEKATGKKFHQLLEEYINDSLHIENTTIDDPLIPVKNRTNYFRHNIVFQVVNATFQDMRYKAPSEGLLSTAEDLVKLGNALLYSEKIPEDVKKRMFEPEKLLSGMNAELENGWMLLKSRNETPVYGRSGSVTGGSAVVLIYPEEKIVIAGVCNLDNVPEKIPVFDMANHFINNSESEQQ